MKCQTIKEKLLAVDNFRFYKILESLDFDEKCCSCYYFNPDIKDSKYGYRCKVSGSCIAATLNADLIKYLWESIKE